MKRLLALLLMSVLLVGCSDQAAKPVEKEIKEVSNAKEIKEEKEESKLQSIKDELSKDFEVGDNEVLAYEMVKANGGIKFTVDDELLELYEYDLNNLTEEQEQLVKQAENGSIDMDGFNIPCYYKDGIMALRLDEHSKAAAIKEKLNNILN